MRRLLCLAILTACSTESEPATGTLSVMVQPEATVHLNGKDEGLATIRNFESLEPGTYEVRLSSDGHEPFTTSVVVSPGETARVQQELIALTITDEADANKATMRFETTPAGATVTVNGEMIGTTPIEGWTPTNEVLEIAIALEGYTPHSETLSEPIATYEHTLTRAVVRTAAPAPRKKAAAEPGFVSIGIVGGGWGHIFVDGKKLEKTAPISKQEIAPGSHTIRVVNEGTGLDWSRDVTIETGKVTKLAAKPN